MNDGCIICKAGFKVPAVKTELVDSLFIDGERVQLCEYHDKLYYEWGTEEERKKMWTLAAKKVLPPLKRRVHEEKRRRR